MLVEAPNMGVTGDTVTQVIPQPGSRQQEQSLFDLPRVETPQQLAGRAAQMDFEHMTVEGFSSLNNGYLEEAGLINRISAGDQARVGEWRQDMLIDKEIPPYQRSVGNTIDEMITSDQPIEDRGYNSSFAYVQRATGEDPKVLKIKLDEMQQSARIHRDEPNSIFWRYSINIGRFKPAIMYRIALERKIERDRVDLKHKEAKIETPQPQAFDAGFFDPLPLDPNDA